MIDRLAHLIAEFLCIQSASHGHSLPMCEKQTDGEVLVKYGIV